MLVPEHLFRCPTREAIDSLALRLNLPNTLHMQDWAWEVADPNRIEEFVKVYQSRHLTEDERFTLMETIIQSFADLDDTLVYNPIWMTVLALIAENIELHIATVYYWSNIESGEVEDSWCVGPFLNTIRVKHRDRFEKAK